MHFCAFGSDFTRPKCSAEVLGKVGVPELERAVRCLTEQMCVRCGLRRPVRWCCCPGSRQSVRVPSMEQTEEETRVYWRLL